MVNFRSDDFNFTNRNTWFSSLLVSSTPGTLINEILIGLMIITTINDIQMKINVDDALRVQRTLGSGDVLVK